MKQVFLFLTIITFCIRLQAQQVYFITIDADDNQPFSVMLGKNNYNSSSVGHLVLSNLKDSTYQLTIKFPKSIFPDHFFTVDINKKDKGYQLRKNAEKAWSMQDLQTMAVIQADRVGQEDKLAVAHTSAKSKDAFAQMMAAVVNDTAVLFTTPHNTETVKKPEETKKEKQPSTENEKQTEIAVNNKKADTLKVIPPPPKKTLPDSALKVDSKTIVSKETNSASEKGKKTETAASTTTKSASDPLKKATVPVVAKKGADGKSTTKPANQKKPDSASLAKTSDTSKVKITDTSGKKIAQRSTIKRLSERWTKETREIVFIDSSDGIAADTIRILIELTQEEEKKPVPDTTAKKPVVVAAAAADNADKKTVPDNPPALNKTKDSISTPVTPGKSPDTVTAKKSVKADSAKKIVIINSDCKFFATEGDVDKLRIKLLAENDLFERIVVARKVFRTKCFTTRQIKSLTELFTSDKARYGFFDAAYPFVSDTENFKQLVEMLTDDYYINRFKMMVRLQ